MNKHEVAYIKWYIGNNKRNVFVIALIYLIMVTLPAVLFPGNMDRNVGMIMTPLTLSLILFALLTCILSMVVAILNYRYLMFKPSCDLYLAMPIKRSHFFYLQYFMGLLVILVIPFLSIVLALCLDPMAMQVLPYYAFFIVCTLLFCAILYTMYSFLTLKCNNFWDAIIICIAYTIMPVFVLMAGVVVMDEAIVHVIVGYGATSNELFDSLYVSGFISIPAVLIGYFDAIMEFATNFLQNINGAEGIRDIFLAKETTSLVFLWYWAFIGVILFFLARHTFIKRSGEDAEQQTTSKICYPVIIFCITISLLFGSGIFTGSYHSSSMPLFVITVVIFGVMNFFAKRNIKIDKSMIIQFLVMIMIGFSLTYTITLTKGFGQIQELPVYEDIQEVRLVVHFDEPKEFTINIPEYEELKGYKVREVTMYKGLDDVEWIHKLYSLQEEIFNKDTFNYGGSIECFYTMKEGREIRRGYSFDKQTEGQIVTLIQAILDDEQHPTVSRSILDNILQKKQYEEQENEMHNGNF